MTANITASTPKVAEGASFQDKSVTAMLERVRKLAPSRYGLFERVYRRAVSPRQTIKAKCLECSNFETKEITHCQVFACPLHGLRPYQGGEG